MSPRYRMNESWGTGSKGFGRASDTGRLALLLIALLVMVALPPAVARAAQTVNAIITDPGGTNQATVDTDGSLHVAGAVTVDPSTPVTTTSADDPGRKAFTTGSQLQGMSVGDLTADRTIDVPPGTRLVITHVSGSASLPAGQTLTLVQLLVFTNGEHAIHYFVPRFTGTLSGSDRYVFSQDTMIYADDELEIVLVRSASNSSGSADAGISGYLIDCSVDPCD